MQIRYQLSQRFYKYVALISSLVTGILFAVPNLIKEGFRAYHLIADCFWGFSFSVIFWWFNMRLFPLMINKFFPGRDRNSMWTIRVILSILLGMFVVYFKVKTNLYHTFLTGEGSAMLVYQFRGLLTSGILLLIIFLIDSIVITQHIETENERLKKENLIAQFETLKQQINPHFLFNSLNILKTMIRLLDPKAEEYVVRLSELYRSLLQNNTREKVLLGEELRTLENYLYMLRARFEEKIRIDISEEVEKLQSYIPPFTLQMLIENCIKHNVISGDKPLHVEIALENGHLVVRNNLQLKRSVEQSSHIGLENINQRYLMLCGKPIVIQRDDHEFSVILPIIDQ